MAKLKCVKFVLPLKYVERKKTRVTAANALQKTGSEEIKTWLRETAKSHWFFYEDRRSYDFGIAFHDPKEAALFKLTWL